MEGVEILVKRDDKDLETGDFLYDTLIFLRWADIIMPVADYIPQFSLKNEITGYVPTTKYLQHTFALCKDTLTGEVIYAYPDKVVFPT